jgi:hypothetical protein
MLTASKLAVVGKNESKSPVTKTRDLAKSSRRTQHSGSPLTAELKAFIDTAIVPALVRQYLAEVDFEPTKKDRR